MKKSTDKHIIELMYSLVNLLIHICYKSYIFVISQIEQIYISMRHTNYYIFNTDLDCEVEHSFPLIQGET